MSIFVINEVVEGIPLSLVSHPGLFSKRKLDLGTRAFIENLILPEEGTVVDLGCGYGPIGIFIALKNPKLKIIMLDINPLAVKTAKLNVQRYHLENRIEVQKSDVLTELKTKVAAIYSNPPLSKGTDFLEKFAEQSSQKLDEKGFIQMIVYKGERNVIKYFSKYFNNIKVIKRIKGYSLIIVNN
ncbi:class I SAM-dependent methyltransferase [Acidianus manzaensis]|uniref:Methyltransferase n=1 Tax=Acidianus manzaensis TaxID=282676 RepID=A0A1W6K3N5_9CREN|nr:methyltransferase [Acidianus manzaensis]ARM77105.1 methyltransferase [Acidianus manzaensis]